MTAIRIQRFEKELTKIISQTINNRLQNKKLNWITITDVKLSSDLSHAKVYFTHISELPHHQVARELNKSCGIIKNDIAKAKLMRIIPEIVFFYDDLAEKADHLEDIFRKIQAEQEGDEEEGSHAAD
ncbi:MAG: 30S ribosome-binding factor RbfA [Candidatus Cloacimonetes bacterium]|nr:30S ribosome-binding factor RbfA [Candidatus Cloacimonadota bacterium]